MRAATSSRAADEDMVDYLDQMMEAVGLRERAAALQSVLVVCAANPHASASEIAAKVRLLAAHGEPEDVVPALPPDVGAEDLEAALELVVDEDAETWPGDAS